jgi:flagellar basal body rod protein FlgG
MGLMDTPVFSALTDKMRWHQTRQGLLAENVANAETPGNEFGKCVHQRHPADAFLRLLRYRRI